MKKFFYFFLTGAFLFTLFISCNRSDNNDRTVEITANVWPTYIEYKNVLGDTVHGIKIKETDSNEWSTIAGISGFQYEEGYEYQIRLLKTYLVNPPMDGSNIDYKLIEVISKTKK
ncbi:DUF4377 domain-containing protein [Elizabethkingia ursingii]|uniref:DUF4377 domain-containing protein n=1 Tax=Elizabethkingia ursingii TaxID=1756150 RepID=A0ABX3NEB7_9FLAO|nr:DUF4377 domain-containing protein [Elizabethkingia ursingii]OPB94445.1 hypothetical protein BB021_17725 [Elizabethkingia ursingii]